MIIMKYALIGCGRIATNHVKAVVNNGLEFVAACDIMPENIEILLGKHSLQEDSSITRYKDYKKMIEEHPEIELIAIATPSGSHAEIALYCIDRGINVIIENSQKQSKRCKGVCLSSESFQCSSAKNQKGIGDQKIWKTVSW